MKKCADHLTHRNVFGTLSGMIFFFCGVRTSQRLLLSRVTPSHAQKPQELTAPPKRGSIKYIIRWRSLLTDNRGLAHKIIYLPLSYKFVLDYGRSRLSEVLQRLARPSLTTAVAPTA